MTELTIAELGQLVEAVVRRYSAARSASPLPIQAASFEDIANRDRVEISYVNHPRAKATLERSMMKMKALSRDV